MSDTHMAQAPCPPCPARGTRLLDGMAPVSALGSEHASHGMHALCTHLRVPLPLGRPAGRRYPQGDHHARWLEPIRGPPAAASRPGGAVAGGARRASRAEPARCLGPGAGLPSLAIPRHRTSSGRGARIGRSGTRSVARSSANQNGRNATHSPRASWQPASRAHHVCSRWLRSTLAASVGRLSPRAPPAADPG